MSLDLDTCPLCEHNIPVMNELVMNQVTALAMKMSEEMLFETMHGVLKENQSLLETQGIEVPQMSKAQLRVHFTSHQPLLPLIIKRDMMNIQRLQESLLNQPSHPTLVNSYIRISNHKVKLIKRWNELYQPPKKIEPYKYE